jgi:hypothetical protein
MADLDGPLASVVLTGCRFDNAAPMVPARVVAPTADGTRPGLIDLGVYSGNSVMTPGMGVFYDGTFASTVSVRNRGT